MKVQGTQIVHELREALPFLLQAARLKAQNPSCEAHALRVAQLWVLRSFPS